MKIVLLSFFSIVAGVPSLVYSGDSPFVPSQRFFSANLEDGTFETSFELGVLNQDDPPIPLRLQFSEAGPACDDLRCLSELTAFAAKATKAKASLWRVTLVCGKTLFFGPEPQGGWRSSDHAWQAQVKDNGALFEMQSNSGWRSSYRDGRLHSLSYPRGRTIVWNYDNRGEVVSLEDEQTGEPICTVHQKNGLFSVRNESKELTVLDYRTPANLVVKQSHQKSLFEFSLERNGLRTTLRQNVPEKASFSWLNMTGIVTATHLGKVVIQPRPSNRPTFQLERENGAIYFRDMDILKGTLEISTPNMRHSTIYHREPGALYFKPKRIETVRDKVRTWETYNYDEEGRTKRIEASSGWIAIFERSERGKVITQKQNGKTISTKEYDSEDRILTWKDGDQEYAFEYSNDNSVEITNAGITIKVPRGEVDRLARE